jgi:hypothetical protein
MAEAENLINEGSRAVTTQKARPKGKGTTKRTGIMEARRERADL